MTPTTQNNSPKFYAVDFFCGAGGTTRGLIDAGGHVVAGVDKESECKKTFETNNINPDGSHAAYLTRDIFKKTDDYPTGEQAELMSDLAYLITPLRERTPGVPLLFSICAPCQPFTNMSRIVGEERQEGRQRDRGLLGQSIDFIERFKPELILCENVAGIQDKKYGGVWQAFMAELEEAGYAVGSAIVDAVKFGVPQFRKRSILMAICKDRLGTDVDLDENGRVIVPMEDSSQPEITAKEALSHLPKLAAGERHPLIPNHQCGRVNDMNRQRLEYSRPGGSNLDYMGTPLELACHARMRAKAATRRSGFTDSYSRMWADRPSAAITTKCYSFTNGRYGHFDPNQVRALSVREAAALQSFPDDYVFISKSLIRAARMVGNAVPPKLGKFFGERLTAMLDLAINEPEAIREAA